ncbi:MAG: protein phosphatase 2C domain-containing protein [Pyrinomonadaceae bacterium MAG19_C2-C3]|nr:protein phosphatase 2C domain-containing protein [Pyrinomonadaceae bacterium MAG19_C2-C3]
MNNETNASPETATKEDAIDSRPLNQTAQQQPTIPDPTTKEPTTKEPSLSTEASTVDAATSVTPSAGKQTGDKPVQDPPVSDKPSPDKTGGGQTDKSSDAQPDDGKTTVVKLEPNTRAVKAEWGVICETVPGASHIRGGIPNQDAMFYTRQSSVYQPVIVAMSDGHGSDKCFRSDRGSRFAVRIACDLFDELIGVDTAAMTAAELETNVREILAAEFINRWRAKVEADIKGEPLTENEYARMIEKDGVAARKTVEANPYLAYGATVVCALVTASFIVYLQLGDGEILIVTEAGEVSLPLAADARLMANETTSLCLPKAVNDFRCAVHEFKDDNLPALILLTTDGYANSFSTTAGFHQVGSDVLTMLREEGFDYVNRHVKAWLEEATQTGSGDDCTLALIIRADAVTKGEN